MYEFLGITLVLAMLLTMNALTTMAAAGLWRLLRGSVSGWSARTRAEMLFVLRLGPPVVSIVWIAAFMIPSYIAHEPYTTNEVVSFRLAALAFISAIGIGAAFWRGIRSWLATRRLLQKWMAAATRIELEEVTVPTFLMPYKFPIIAVVGTFRPRLFIAEHVLKTLSEEELSAALSHEYGHMAAHDNLKRSLMRASRAALMIIPCGRVLDKAWGEASESAADEYAAQTSSNVALNLASALVRIARMIPLQPQAAVPVSATCLVGGEESRGVKARVRRLVELAADPSMLASNAPLVRFVPWLALTTVVVVSVTIESRPQVLAAIHHFIEHVVAILT
jgi:Zn-dependent protease with chaperone function